METSQKSILEHMGAIVTIAGAVAALTAYCVSLQFSLNEANREISRLDKQMEALNTKVASEQSATRGEKGDKGDIGAQGPRGERGAPGDPGASGRDGPPTDLNQLKAMVEDAVASKISLLPKASGAVSPSASTVVSQFDLSSCVTSDELQAQPTAVIQKGIEICQPDGQELVSVVAGNEHSFTFKMSGDYLGITCALGATCSWGPNSLRAFKLVRIDPGANGLNYTIKFR